MPDADLDNEYEEVMANIESRKRKKMDDKAETQKTTTTPRKRRSSKGATSPVEAVEDPPLGELHGLGCGDG